MHEKIGTSNYTWCGSDYDARGNERFQGTSKFEYFNDGKHRNYIDLNTREMAAAATYEVWDGGGLVFRNFVCSHVRVELATNCN